MSLIDHSKFYPPQQYWILLDFFSPVNDPFAWYRRGQNEAVKFYDYQAWLPPEEVGEVLSVASFEAHTHRGELPLSTPLRFTAGNVQLAMMPREGMDWWAWGTALWGMRLSVQNHGMYFEWHFKVVSREFGEIGYGSLTNRRREAAGTSKR